MADALARLAGPQALTGVAATIYTTPAATTAVVRAVHVVNETTTSAAFTLSVGVDGAGKRFFYAQQVAPGDSFDWSGNLVLAAGDVLQAYASAPAALTITISGVTSA